MTIPAKLVELSMTVDSGLGYTTINTKMFALYLVTPDQNTGHTLVSAR